MKVCVVGAGGAIGSRLVKHLVDDNHQVVAAVRSLSSAVRIGRMPVDIVKMDVSRVEQGELDALFSGADVVVDCSFSKLADANERIAESVKMAQRIGTAANNAKVKRLIHYGTISVYPTGDIEVNEATPCKPRNDSYADCKLAAEQELFKIASQTNLPLVVLQLPVVYGPFLPWTTMPVTSMSGKTLVMPEALKGECSAIHVDDVCKATIMAMHNENSVGEKLLLYAREPVSWNAYFTEYKKLSDNLRLRMAGPEEINAVLADRERNARPFQGLKNAFKFDSNFRQLVLRQFGFRHAYKFVETRRGRSGIDKIKQTMITENTNNPSEQVLDSKRIQTMDTMPKIRSTKANDLIGFSPSISLSEGVKGCEEWLKWARLL